MRRQGRVESAVATGGGSLPPVLDKGLKARGAMLQARDLNINEGRLGPVVTDLGQRGDVNGRS